MPDWIPIKIKTEADKFDYVRTKIEGWPQEVAEEVYWPALEQIGQEGVLFMRWIIDNSPTKTGEERVRRGGRGPGRVKDGKMRRNVRRRVRRRVKNAFSMFVGWSAGNPGYSIFQEQGTKNGVAAMNALGQAQEYMLSEIRKLSAGRYSGSAKRWEDRESE